MKLSRKAQEALGIPLPERKPRQAPEQSRELFLAMCKAHKLPEPAPEFKFSKKRRWRFDWAWVATDRIDRNTSTKFRSVSKVALEIQGALYTGGRHTRGPALIKEYEKLNEAQMLGWKVLLVTPQQVKTGEAFQLVRRALGL